MPFHWPDWRVRGEADQGGDFAPVEAAEFGQFGDQGAGDGRPDAGHGGDEVLFLPPGRRAAHRLVDVGLEAGELLLQRGEQTGDAFLQALFGQALLALALGDDHLDDLASPSDKIGQKPGLFVGHRPDVRFGCLDEMGDYRRVDRVGLGSFAERLGESAHLAPD